MRVAFIAVIEGATGGARDVAPFDFPDLRRRFKQGNEQGAWIVNNGYTRRMALAEVAGGASTRRCDPRRDRSGYDRVASVC